MEYTQLFTEDELEEFEVIENFHAYIRNNRERFVIQYDFHQKIFNCEVELSGTHNEVYEFSRCYFKSDLNITNASFERSVIFDNCYFADDLTVSGNSVFKKGLMLDAVIVNRHIWLKEGDYASSHFRIINVDYFTIMGGKFERLLVTGRNVGKSPTINANLLGGNFLNVEGSLVFSGLNVEDIVIQGRPLKPLSVEINSCTANKFNISNYINTGNLRFSHIRALDYERSNFFIRGSRLNNTEFSNLDFNTYKNVCIEDSHIVDCSFTSVKWKYDISAYPPNLSTPTYKEIRFIDNSSNPISYIKSIRYRWDKSYLVYYARLREVYRQLKFVSQKHADVINEQKFHSREMRAHNRSLHPIKDFFTKLIIKFSYWFSDYGQSYMRPIFWLLIGHYVLFSIASSSGVFKPIQFHWHFELPSANVFYEYFRLLNPLRRPDETFKGYSIIIDIVMRIWSSYMIYNIIRATRRFIK